MVARRLFRGWKAVPEDAVSEGMVGLIEAAIRFDASLGYAFSTYAIYRIRARILDYMYRTSSVASLGRSRDGRRLFWGIVKAQQTDALEVSVLLDAPVEHVEVLMAHLQASNLLIDIDTDTQISVPDTAPSPEEAYEQDQDRHVQTQALRLGLQGLDARERDIIKHRKLSETPKTLDELGKVWGVSGERIRQIEDGAMAKLKIPSKKKLGGSISIGQPVESYPVLDDNFPVRPTDPALQSVPQLRLYDCRLYDRCLDYVIRKDWANFSCVQCTKYQKTEEVANAAADIAAGRANSRKRGFNL